MIAPPLMLPPPRRNLPRPRPIPFAIILYTAHLQACRMTEYPTVSAA
jgi:hypothetical protein